MPNMTSRIHAPHVKAVDVEIKTQTSFFGRLRAYFFTGLVITAPIAITVWATYWFVTLFDAWVKPFMPSAYNPDTYLPFRVPGFGLIFALITITVIGFMAANLVGPHHDRPLGQDCSTARRWCARSTRARSRSSRRCSRRRAPPSATSAWWNGRGGTAWSIAFVSREVDGGQVGLEPGRAMYAVYVSTTPNPTSGYVFFVDVGE